MAMNWYVRIAIGAVLGLAATLGLAFFLDGWIVPAAVGALLAPIAFLGTFFVWSADLPPSPESPQGYEQVLFDGPNSAVSGILIVAFVALAFFVRFDAGGADDPSAYLAAREPLVTDLQTLHDNYARTLADYRAGTVSAADFTKQLQDDRKTSRELFEEAKTLVAPASYEEDAKSVRIAAEQLSASIESMDLCVSGIAARCDTAAARLADHEAAMAALAGAAGETVADEAAAA